LKDETACFVHFNQVHHREVNAPANPKRCNYNCSIAKFREKYEQRARWHFGLRNTQYEEDQGEIKSHRQKNGLSSDMFTLSPDKYIPDYL
jgi:hypothetical protein